MGWTEKYKKSIDCSNPKGFSQKAHCQGRKKTVNEEGLRDWFGKSKSKDGKKGWVNVVTGGTCASDEPGEGTPKCVSSAKRASMTKAERLSASRRKKKADPGQQSKSGAAKPTYVKTDSPKKMKKEEVEVTEAKDKPGKGSGKKDACYHKVKSRYKVWPSAYASGALVKCRKKGADNWGNSTKKEGFTPSQIAALESIGAIEINEAGKKCWKGYKKVGTQKLFGKTYNRCEKEEVENVSGQADSSPVTEAVTVPRENGQLMRVFLTFRGKFYMVQLFFPSLKTPTKQEVTDAVQKIYPDARVTQYTRSTVDPTQPLIRVSEQTEQEDKQKQAIQRKQLVLNRQKLQLQQKAVQKGGKTDMHMQEESDSEKKYCRLCKKKETKSQCGYGPKMWEKYSVDDATEKEQEEAAEESGITSDMSEAAAWTKKSGKNPSGGLNEKGRKSYERENPGSDLKAPSKKVGNKRRASFCARMKGMKKKLTSAKTANDPDSRINKSLRAWNC
jgi:hypothetical protein